jgi:peptide/nickel transport system permease protein
MAVRAEQRRGRKSPALPRPLRSAGVGLAIGWMALLVVLALFADLIGLSNYATEVGGPRIAPFAGGTWETILGTDNYGRGILARLAHGARISLSVGIGAVLLGGLIGTVMGIVAVRFRKVAEPIIDTMADVVLAVPPLILMLTLVSALTPSVWTLVIGLTIWVIPSFARLVKANAMSTERAYYVQAAEALGASHFSIMFREILPNIMGSIVAYAVVVTANLIVAEGSLSFLGLGAPPPTPSWGGMIAGGRAEIVGAPHIALIPCVVIFLTVLSHKAIGHHLQKGLDVREAKL